VLVSGYAATQDITAIVDVALGKPMSPSLFVSEVRRLLGADHPAVPDAGSRCAHERQLDQAQDSMRPARYPT
jgi:hypothetical protein